MVEVFQRGQRVRTIGAAVAAVVSAVIGLAGCGDDSTSVPQPVPVPKVSLIRRSFPEKTQAAALVVGIPGATAGAGRIEARDIVDGGQGQARTATVGSFAVLVPTTPSASPSIEVRYVDSAGNASQWTSIEPRHLGPGPVLGAQNSGGDGPVSSVDGRGLVVVTNVDSSGSVIVAADPNVDVLISNGNNGEVVETTTDAGGVFRAEILAQAGDPIHVVLLDPSDPTSTGNYRTFTVPTGP